MAGGSGRSRQRERLIEAMTIVASRRGYAAASVAQVVSQAGMSRATFYEHFEDRDDCFLAAFRAAAEGVRERLEGAATGRRRSLLARALALAEEDPDMARLALLEARAGNAAVRAEQEEILTLLEAAIEGRLDADSRGRPSLAAPARVLLGGVGSLVGTRVFRREANSLGPLVDDLAAWLNSYALPVGERRLSPEQWQELGRAWSEIRRECPPPTLVDQRSLPRGKSALSPSEVARAHRERIIEAVARCVREKGYAETSVTDLVAGAGITRAAFYNQFRSKEDAFLSAQVLGLERSAGLAASRFFVDAPWPERVWNLAEALVAYFIEHLDLAHASLVEAYAAGPAAIQRAFESRMAYTLFLEEGYRQRPQAEELPRICSEAIAGGIEELLRHQIVLGRADRAQELVPQAVFVTLAPFVGTEPALELVRRKCRRAA